MTNPQRTQVDGYSRYRVFAAFRGTDLAEAATPYLIPPKVAIDSAFTLILTNLFQRPPARDPVALAITNDDFEIGWSEANLKGVNPDKVGAVQAKVIIKKQNAWRVGAAARQALRANFLDLCARVEAYELTSGCLVPGGAALIATRVAEALPLPIGDTLLYHTGFTSGLDGVGSPFVDLRPGMRLRVDFAANQFIAPGSPLNGLVGAGQSVFTIGRDSSRRIVLDSFLSAIAAPELAAPPGQATASGVLDFQGSGAARRHYRLIYPAQMPAPTAPGDGRLTRNVALLGADTLADLRSATSSFINDGTLGAAASGNLPIVALGFRGRAAVIPEIGIYVRRQAGSSYVHETAPFVPVGTTLRQLLDQHAGTWNPASLAAQKSNALRLLRFWFEGNGVPQYRQVELSGSPLSDPRVFELPLIQGDRIELNFVEG